MFTGREIENYYLKNYVSQQESNLFFIWKTTFKPKLKQEYRFKVYICAIYILYIGNKR